MVGEVDSNEPQTVVDGGGGEVVPVNVRCTNGSKFIVRTSLESTVESFKALVAQNCEVPANQQRLIYKGRILKDDHTLLSYGKILKDLTFCGFQTQENNKRSFFGNIKRLRWFGLRFQIVTCGTIQLGCCSNSNIDRNT